VGVVEPDGTAPHRKMLVSVAAGLLVAIYVHLIRTRRNPPPGGLPGLRLRLGDPQGPRADLADHAAVGQMPRLWRLDGR
jgi:hypothetical protein